MPATGGVAALLLAAGEGARFDPGRPKLLVPLGGRPLVAWAIEAAVAADLDAVAVVAGAVDLAPVLAALHHEITLLANPRWALGQGGSLRVGLDWCAALGMRAAVVGLGDAPLVPASAWRAVGLAAHAPIVAATFGGVRRPPVRLDRSVWGMVAADGDEGARELMRRRPELVGAVACEGDPADVDTLDDLRRVESVVAAGSGPRAAADAEGG